jgi:5-methylcytosine-specific restriction protein A
MHPLYHLIGDFLAGRPLAARAGGWSRERGLWLRDHGLCAVCGFDENLNVHHIIPYHVRKDLELDRGNFITLGERCPTGNHHLLYGHLGDWKSWNANVVAMAAEMYKLIHSRPHVAAA